VGSIILVPGKLFVLMTIAGNVHHACDTRYSNAPSAAVAPEPAATTICLSLPSVTSPAAKMPRTPVWPLASTLISPRSLVSSRSSTKPLLGGSPIFYKDPVNTKLSFIITIERTYSESCKRCVTGQLNGFNMGEYLDVCRGGHFILQHLVAAQLTAFKQVHLRCDRCHLDRCFRP